MSRRLIIAAVFAGALSLSSGLALAHHSVRVNYDMESPVEFTGTIKEIDIRNPHSQIVLDVVEEDGTVVEWFVEWSDKNALVRRKVGYDRIQVGDEVTITGLQNRRLAHVAYFRQAVLSDGSILRDCGFGAFRESVVNSTEFNCD